jgi:hypothetical protein
MEPSMALPVDVNQILFPSKSPPLTGDWAEEFGSYPWFRLTAFPARFKAIKAPFGDPLKPRPLLHKEGVRRLRDAELRERAATRIPAEWREKFDLDWDIPLGKAQIDRVMTGQAVTLDRACLIVAALDILLEEKGHGNRLIQEIVRIAPSIFRLKKLELNGGEFLRNHFYGSEVNKKRFESLKGRTQCVTHEFFDELKNSKIGFTYITLKIVETGISEKVEGYFDGDLRPIPERKHGMRASQFDPAHFPDEVNSAGTQF